MSIAMTPRHRLVSGGLIVAVLAVLAAGSFVVWQNGRDDGVQSTATGPGPTMVVTVDPNAPPELKTTGEDWDGIVRSILGYQDWLFTHPKPELLSNIMLPTYERFDFFKLGLTNLATKGWRYDPQYRPPTVQLVRLFERPRPDMAVVFVRSFGYPNRVVDPAGKVIEDGAGVGDVSVLWTLKSGIDGDARWKLEKVTSFTESPPKTVKLRIAIAVASVLASLSIVWTQPAYAQACPTGNGGLTSNAIIANVVCPDGPVGSGTQPNTGGNENGQGATVGGSTNGGGGGGSGHNPYRWTRDWLDGDYGTFPRPDCHELPPNNCQDFELGGVSSPLTCALGNGQPGRPYRDTLVNTDTGEVVSQAQGCFDPVTGTSTTGNGTPREWAGSTATAAHRGEVLQATNLPRLGFGLSPNGRDCSVAGASALPATPAPPCAAGEAPGLTGLETLLWVDPPPPAEVSVTVNIRGYSVTTTAHPTRYRWEMRQSGDTPSTRNPDPTLETTTPGTRTAPAARYRWETKGDYRLSLAVVWEGNYTFTGFGVSRTEALGPVTGQATVVPYHVVEVRAVPTAAAP